MFKYFLKLVAALFIGLSTFIATSASAQSLDLTKLGRENISEFQTVMEKTKAGARTERECKAACSGKGVEGNAVCLDWCNCRYGPVSQTAKKCDEIYSDAGMKRPPDVYKTPPVTGCSKCAVKPVTTKECLIENAFGPEEDITVTVACDDPKFVSATSCSACEQSFTIQQVCCSGTNCEAKPCMFEGTFRIK